MRLFFFGDYLYMYSTLNKDKLSTHEVLELALKAYKGFLPDFYRIEIINDETGEVIDYIEDQEVKEI